jgi:hypothetical protein
MQALVDLGAQENYVLAQVVVKARLRLLRKQEPYPLFIADRKEIRIIHKVVNTKLTI